MRFRLGVLVGFGAGYYLGAMAGRERFEQLNRVVKRAAESDTVQGVAQTVETKMEQASTTMAQSLSTDGTVAEREPVPTSPL